MSTFPPGTWTLTARWVFPVDGPPRERGVVAVADDKITAVEPRSTLTADIDLGDAAVLPGLVNAHTHLDLSGMRGLAPPTAPFTDWLRQVIAHRRSRTPDQVQADVRAGLAECLRLGTTLLGDVSSDGGSWDALAEAPLRAVVFREMLGLTRARARTALAAAVAWLRAHPPTQSCRPGLSPHAPYSVRASLFRAAARLARRQGLPVAVHTAESPDELVLLGNKTGPFVDFLQELGVWDPAGLIDHYEHLTDLFRGVRNIIYVHANYMILMALPESVRASRRVLCPRTRAAFGFVGGPIKETDRTGTRIAIGTDSLASNPDLDVLAEIRFLHRRHPDVPGATLLRMATLSGAEALGWDDETGSLAPGKSADLVVVPLQGDDPDPYRLLLGADGPVRRVLFRGRWVGPTAVGDP